MKPFARDNCRKGRSVRQSEAKRGHENKRHRFQAKFGIAAHICDSSHDPNPRICIFTRNVRLNAENA
jgi:hypothetical protein